MVSVYNVIVYITNQFQTTFGQGGWGGGVKSVTGTIGGCNSKEENSEDFCPNHVQEFGLCTRFLLRERGKGRGCKSKDH